MGRRQRRQRPPQRREHYENVSGRDEEEAAAAAVEHNVSTAAAAPAPDRNQGEHVIHRAAAAAAASNKLNNDSNKIGELSPDHHHGHHHGHHTTNTIPKRKFLYVTTLIVALWMMEVSTESSVFHIVQQHEPSIRIFRALLEGVLVLLGTAFSVAVWRRWLGHDTTAQLLFQPADHDNEYNNENDWNNHNIHNIHNTDEVEEEYDSDAANSSTVRDNAVYDYDSDDDTNISITEETSLRVPSPWWITAVALDLLVWILMALVLYAVTAVQAVSSSIDNKNDVGRFLSLIAAPTFPLFLFVAVLVQAVHPWRPHRRPVWKVLYWTLSAPFCNVTFRDGMIGDVLTSTVRPMQDVAFTIFYILFGMRGWYSNRYFFPDGAIDTAAQSERLFLTQQQEQVIMMDDDGSASSSSLSSFVNAADANVPVMEKSWIVHTVVLPACMISPLWWRFLQNMRQVYDQQQRWPFLGNALKYFCAASVAMTGVYHPHLKSSPTWLTCFVVATLYQIWWDLFMDWGLFVRNAETGRFQLRSQRLYPYKSIYWLLTVINTLLRFCWTLSFVPLRYLSAAGVLQENFSGDTWSSILAPTIASAEIVRRTLWGILRVEYEAIKLRGDSISGSGKTTSAAAAAAETTKTLDSVDDHDEPGGGLEMTPMKMGSNGTNQPYSYASSSSLEQRIRQIQCTSDMSSMSKVQILAELCLYTTAFAVVGLVAAAHRETL